MQAAVLSLYINDLVTEDIRSTKDIDISLSVVGFIELERFREQLTLKKIKQAPDLKITSISLVSILAISGISR